jgi:hypothetical protein
MILAGTPELDRRELQLRWWTFAGGRINATLRYALEALSPGWKIVPSRFAATSTANASAWPRGIHGPRDGQLDRGDAAVYV